MAWNTTNEGVPYHPLVAPEVPVAPNIQPVGGELGSSIVSAFVHRAIAAEQTNLDQQKLLQNADLAAKGLQLDAQKQQQTYEVAKENADSLEQYRSDEQAWHEKTYHDRQTVLKNTQDAKHAQDEAMISFANDINTTDARSTRDVKPFLSTATYKDNPAEAYRMGQAYIDKYSGAEVGSTPQNVKLVQDKINNLKVPYVAGASFVNAKGESTSGGKKGIFSGSDLTPDQQLMWRLPNPKNPAQWIAAKPYVQLLPISKIDEMYQDPVNHDQIAAGLAAGGHGTIVRTTDPNDKNKTTVSFKLDQYGQRLLDGLGKTREDVTNVASAASRTKTPKLWQIKAGMGNQPALPDASNEALDNDMSQYKAAMSAHPDQADYINSVWSQKHPDQPPPQ